MSTLSAEIALLRLDDITRVVLSAPKANEASKITIRSVIIHSEKMWQIEKFINNKVFHRNIKYADIISCIEEYSNNFKQITVIAGDSIYEYRITKKGKLIKHVSPYRHKTDIDMSHDRARRYILSEGVPIPPLVDLGIFNKEHKIIKSKFDKFKQINRFIELIDDELKDYKGKKIKVIDIGCGKSYLTFVLYHYLVSIKGLEASIIGYDIKEDVVEECICIAQKYNYSGMKFFNGDITNMKSKDINADLIITLHACDTLTDYALHYAMENNIKYIFSVPCCQHELNGQLSCDSPLSLLLEHGLIKERFASLLTDSIRGEILKNAGYHVDVIEFVDFSHSPKNLMIRAVKSGRNNIEDDNRLKQIIEAFNINPKLIALNRSSKTFTSSVAENGV